MKRLAAFLAAGMLALTGCSDTQPPKEEENPAQLLADAKKTLDETSSVHFLIQGRDLPSSGQVLSKGDGVATHAPAFKGKLSISSAGTALDADVVAVGGKVYVKLPFTPSYNELTPSQLAAFGAPDPAVFLDPNRGVSSLLTTAKNLAIKGETRDGSRVLTEVTGNIPGAQLAAIFPQAPKDKDFPTTFTVDKSAKQLAKATITGPFYSSTQNSTYDVGLDRYGEQVQITKP